MKHKDIRRDMHRIALERELLWLGIALALYIAASAVGAVYVNLPKWATLILAIVPIVVAAVTPLRNSLGKILGGKTGYTSEAGHCLASFAEIEGREYIFVSAGASGADGNTIPHIQDAVTIYNRVGAAIEAKMNNENE